MRLRARLATLLTKSALAAVLVGGVAALAFVELSEEVIEGETAALDEAVSHWLRRWDSETLGALLAAVTTLGSTWVIVVVVALGAAWSWRRGSRETAAVVTAVGISAGGLNWLLKWIFQRPRPSIFPDALVASGYSYPSGHTMASAAVYGVIALAIWRLAPRARWPAVIVATALVFAIGLSRVYLGVHWATDVVAGLAAGVAVFVAGAQAPRVLRTPPSTPPT
jgi:membrane-associated phospholipid phosphatase